MYDVIIIGAGVTGCAVARELSRYQRKVLILERASDICEGTSKANSGIVHSGYDAEPGSMKARMNLRGNQMMEQLSKDLDFPYRKNGSLVLCFHEEDRAKLQILLDRGRANQVPELRILEKEELQNMEPEISENAIAALYAPTGGIVCPFGLTIALAENAADNGVEFRLNTEVTAIEKISEQKNGKNTCHYRILTQKGEEECRFVINAAGVYADRFHNMVSRNKIHITPRRGEYCLLDQAVGKLVDKTVFQLPGKKGKGVLVTPTVHGNLLIGPTAEDIEDKEAVNTTREGMDTILSLAAESIRHLPKGQVITSFAGLRAHEEGGDFLIGEAEDASGFLDAAGIESPGLTSAPAIGEYLAELLQKTDPVPEKENFISTRKGIPDFRHASEEEQKKLIEENPAYAHMICRCELVTEGEILSAIHRTLGATTLDGIKRRTREGMGRCQSGFCAPKTIEILARELKTDKAEITKCGGKSVFLVGKDKDNV